MAHSGVSRVQLHFGELLAIVAAMSPEQRAEWVLSFAMTGASEGVVGDNAHAIKLLNEASGYMAAKREQRSAAAKRGRDKPSDGGQCQAEPSNAKQCPAEPSNADQEPPTKQNKAKQSKTENKQAYSNQSQRGRNNPPRAQAPPGAGGVLDLDAIKLPPFSVGRVMGEGLFERGDAAEVLRGIKDADLPDFIVAAIADTDTNKAQAVNAVKKAIRRHGAYSVRQEFDKFIAEEKVGEMEGLPLSKCWSKHLKELNDV